MPDPDADRPHVLAALVGGVTLCADCIARKAAISSFRAARSPLGLARTLSKTVITTYGRDVAVASTLFHRAASPGKVGRQMQTWARFADGWRIAAAHVSMIDADDPAGHAR